jgi:hypothetical protein
LYLSYEARCKATRFRVSRDIKALAVDFARGGTGLGSRLINSLIREGEGSIIIDRNVSFGRVQVELNALWRQEATSDNAES